MLRTVQLSPLLRAHALRRVPGGLWQQPHRRRCSSPKPVWWPASGRADQSPGWLVWQPARRRVDPEL